MATPTRERIRLGVVVPTYNEADNLPKLVKRIKSVLDGIEIIDQTTLLIVDDNSPDGSGKVADKIANAQSTVSLRIEVLHRDHKAGLGKAYTAGIGHLLNGNYTHILQMDADLSHDPIYIQRLIEKAKSASLVVGSRYVTSGATPDWNIWRKLQSRLGNMYARILLGNMIHDYTGGFNLYSTNLLKQIDLDAIKDAGYGFQIELKYRALQTGNKVTEIPIVFVDRVNGKSKIPKSTLVNTLLLVPMLHFKR